MSGNSFIEGIDVSKWQGNVNWQRVRAADKQFVFARVSDGLHIVDPYFDSNWRQLGQLGVFRGAYQMFDASQDPRAQADLLVQMIGQLEPEDLPPVLNLDLDLDLPGGPSTDEVVANALTWLKAVEARLGHAPIVYTAHIFWKQLGNPEGFSDYPLWVADYEVSEPLLPAGWQSWNFWQYSESGQVPGIEGAVSLDRFNGTLEDLKKLACGVTSHA
jgi:lysozyme